ncbi:MAG: PfkB family carbohydrate kinase [candidate division Zixibacteria bacterium]|nr:PfkB family carbohydrate kinase [candidate division Zixibacteria bacterium]
MPEHERIDCLGLGIIPFDILYTIATYPRAEAKIDALDFNTQGGGPVPNAMVGLSRLGLKTAVIAAVGDDLFGEYGVAEMKREKVDTRFIIVKKRTSAIATGYIEKGSGRRTMVLYRNITVEPGDINTRSLPLPRLVHLDGRDMPATMKLARWGRRMKATISFDIGSVRNDVSEVFGLVDHLVVADGFAFPFTGCRTARRAIKKLAERCPGKIVVTEGIRGSTGFENGAFYTHKAFRVENVDATGAGDAFHVGYIFGLLKGTDMAERLRLGAAVAALKCMQPGGRTGLPDRRQLQRFLKSNPKSYA